MEKVSIDVLSEYQQAILTEMGISAWQLLTTKSSSSNSEDAELAKQTPELASKEDALTKLQQLREQTQPLQSTTSVLVTLPREDTEQSIFNDLLIALDVEFEQVKLISTEQLGHYTDFPLSWVLGEKTSLDNNRLVTPALTELHQSVVKKQLWQQLQTFVHTAAK